MSDAGRQVKPPADRAQEATAAAAPKVTVGLAVYNGEKFLDEAIASIRAQSFEDFELVICDNASTDATAEICARHAERDPRVRYFRNPQNIGGVRNENRTLFLARGSYFKLAAHDDKIQPRFIELCVAELDAHPELEVCATGVLQIDAQGAVTARQAPRAGSERCRHHRIRSITSREYGCEASYGLMRTQALREVRPQTNHLHSDRVVLCELALRQPFRLIEEPLFLKRHHEGNVYRDWRARMAWYQPELVHTGAIRLPHWLQALDYCTMLGRSRIEPLDRVRCAGEVLLCIWRMRGNLIMDVVDALRMWLRGRSARRRRYGDESGWR